MPRILLGLALCVVLQDKQGEKGIAPGDGFAIVASLERRLVWGSTAIQTPTPLSSDAAVNFADAAATWAVAVKAPTSSYGRVSLSPGGKHIASCGVEFHEAGVRDAAMVVNLVDGKTLWHQSMKEEFFGVSWESDTRLLYWFDAHQMKPNSTPRCVIRRLEIESGKETAIYTGPDDAYVLDVDCSKDGSRAIVCESTKVRGRDRLKQLDLRSLETRDLLEGADIDVASLSWIRKGEAVFAKIDGIPTLLMPTEKSVVRKGLFDDFEGLKGKKLDALPAPSGSKVILVDEDHRLLQVADLRTREVVTLVTAKEDRVISVWSGSWTHDETVAGIWLMVSGSGGASCRPLLIDLQNRKIATFRAQKTNAPMLFIENDDAVEALRKAAKPWK